MTDKYFSPDETVVSLKRNCLSVVMAVSVRMIYRPAKEPIKKRLHCNSMHFCYEPIVQKHRLIHFDLRPDLRLTWHKELEVNSSSLQHLRPISLELAAIIEQPNEREVLLSLML
jgi:hypothetical protein